MLAKSTMLTLKKKNLSLIWSGFHTEIHLSYYYVLNLD